MQVIKQRTATVPIDALLPSPENVNLGDVGAISQSIEANAWFGSVLVQESSGLIIAGEHRWRAAKALGAREIPVTYADVDDDRARRIRLADNRTAHLAHDDPERLAHLLQELAETPASLAGTGYDGDALDELLADLGQTAPELAGDPDAVPDVPEEPVSRSGDLWVLGEHRLVCGDAGDPADIAQLLQGCRVDLIVTSPPYNQALDTWERSGMHAEGHWGSKVVALAYADARPEDEYQRWQAGLLQTWHDHLKVGASLFYNHKNRYRDKELVSPLRWLPGPFRLRQEIVWRRPGSVTQNARMFMPCDERIYWMYRGDDFYFDDTTEHKTWSTVWDLANETNLAQACAFPVELPRRIIRAVTRPGGCVWDPFAGSGTTVIAAEQEHRTAYLMEREPAYVDVAVRRWEDYTGRKAELCREGVSASA